MLRCSFGISIPTTDLPGITSTIRTLITASERARSFTRPLMRLTLRPGAGWISNRVTTGPGNTDTTSASMPKSFSFSSSSRDMPSSDSPENSAVWGASASSSKEKSGNSAELLISKRGCWRGFTGGRCSGRSRSGTTTWISGAFFVARFRCCVSSATSRCALNSRVAARRSRRSVKRSRQ